MTRKLSCAFLLTALAGITGCQMVQGPVEAPNPTATTPSSRGSGELAGVVHGGQQPVSGATIQLYAVGTSGYGSTATGLISPSAQATPGIALTDANGNFNITGQYSCPMGDPEVYLTATGGNPGLAPGTNNSAIVLVAALTDCNTLQANAAKTTVILNEATTVASTYALAQFFGTGVNIGSYSTYTTGLVNAFATVGSMVSTSAGSANSVTPVGIGYVPQAEINSLANILATCVNSTGPSSPSCAALFSAATPSGGTSPTTILGAVLDIALNPGNNVTALYDLSTANAPFQPALTAAPNDWTIGLAFDNAGSHPHYLALDSVGNVWATDNISSNPAESGIYVMSNTGQPYSNSPYDSSSNLNLPNGIAVDLNDVAWVGNEGNGTVVGVNLSGGSTQLLYGPIATNETAGELLGAAVDGSNNIWFAGYGNGTYPANVYELVPQPTFSNGYSINYYDNSGLYGPYNLAIDASGDAWAANYAAASITKLTPATGGTAGGATASTFSTGSGNVPLAIAIDGNSNVWATNREAAAVFELNSTGTLLSPSGGFTAGITGNCNAIAVDGGGNIWVADTYAVNAISKLSPSGTPISPSTGYQSSTLSYMADMAIDASGNIWLLNGAPVDIDGHEGITEFVGLAAPTIMPLARAAATNQIGQRPTTGFTFSGGGTSGSGAEPTISGLSTSSGSVGTTVTITGTNFGSSQDASVVTFNGIAAGPASAWSASSITIAVPAGATTGNVVVIVGEQVSNGLPFTVTAAPIVNFSVNPTSITLGASATLAWSSTNATSCTAGGAWSGTLATSGTQMVTPASASLSMPGVATYTLACQNSTGQTATASAALPVTYPAPTGRLSQVRSFEVVTAANIATPGIYSDIANSYADLVILNQCAFDPPVDRSQADPNHTKLIFGYVDVSEAFSCAEPSLFSSETLPSWFGNVNPGWAGLYTVQYWNPAWEPIVFSIIDQAVADGYDGIFLDVLTGDFEWSAGNTEGNPVYPGALSASEKLLSDIRSYVNTNYSGKDFYLIGNNPNSIAIDNVALLKSLDAIFNESAYWVDTSSSVAVYQGAGSATYLNWLALQYATLGVPILGNDYPPLTNTSADLATFELYNSLGWIPSVTILPQGDSIFSTGPFMFMATPTNSTVTGNPNFINFISGGVATNATLIGGNQGDYFIGGPGQNTITGGSGNDTIYAHPANNVAKNNELILDLSSQILGTATIPSVNVLVNGNQVIQPTPITTAYGTTSQRLQVNLGGTLISSVQIVVTNTSYTNTTNLSNIEIDDIIYDGVQINLTLGQYPEGGAFPQTGQPPFAYSNSGTVTFPGSALAVISAFPANTSDVINGGGGTNTVVYRAPYSNYSVTQKSNGSWLVTSAATAEGPDTLTNIQILVFSDQQITLP